MNIFDHIRHWKLLDPFVSSIPSHLISKTWFLVFVFFFILIKFIVILRGSSIYWRIEALLSQLAAVVISISIKHSSAPFIHATMHRIEHCSMHDTQNCTAMHNEEQFTTILLCIHVFTKSVKCLFYNAENCTIMHTNQASTQTRHGSHGLSAESTKDEVKKTQRAAN